MKRYGNLFDKICDIENIKNAHRQARKDKSFYREVKKIDNNVDYYAKKIRNMLLSKSYKIKSSGYTSFMKNDKGKDREIFKLSYYPHRLIQWAIMLQIQHIFLNTFISNTFSSIPNRGIHLASNKLRRDLKQDEENTKYCLKIDVKKFYPNINHSICKSLIRRKIKDKDLLWLMDNIIDSMDGDKGIAIGSLFSQWMGNFYMSYFDHWIKEDLSIKYYYRYCDDIVILHEDKTFLHELKTKIERYLNSNLKLTVKDNWQVFPTRTRGIDFVGYRHFGDYILLRKTTAKQLKRRMKTIRNRCHNRIEMSYSDWCSINSYRGWIIWCDGFNLTKKYIEPLIPYTNEYYRKNIKGGGKNVCISTVE